MRTLRASLLQLAHARHELRSDLLPLLRQAGEEHTAKKWIQEAISEEGSLRKYFGVKEGEKIPTEKLKEEQKKLRDKEERTEAETKRLRQINLALTLRSKEVKKG